MHVNEIYKLQFLSFNSKYMKTTQANQLFIYRWRILSQHNNYQLSVHPTCTKCKYRNIINLYSRINTYTSRERKREKENGGKK